MATAKYSKTFISLLFIHCTKNKNIQRNSKKYFLTMADYQLACFKYLKMGIECLYKHKLRTFVYLKHAIPKKHDDLRIKYFFNLVTEK